MTYRLAFNTTDRPVLIDQAGRSLAGGEWGAVLTTDDAVRAAVDGGQLVWAVDSPDGDPVLEANTRADRLGQLDREQLLSLAVDADLLEAPGDDDPKPTKSELLLLLVPTQVPVPAATPRRRAAADTQES